MKCLDRWIDNTNIEGTLLASNPIFQFSLAAFNREDLFEQAVDTAITILRRFRCSEMAIIATLFPRAVAMNELWQANVRQLQAAEDPEDCEDQANICRAICRLATEAAEACMPVIVGDSDNGQMSLVSLLIDCVAYRFDFGIARIPLRLFNEICWDIQRARDHLIREDLDYEPGEDYEPRSQLSIR